jgi:hypothetical protein
VGVDGWVRQIEMQWVARGRDSERQRPKHAMPLSIRLFASQSLHRTWVPTHGWVCLVMLAGEIALVYASERMADVVATDDIEVFALSRQRFLTLATQYPELYNHLRKAASERIRHRVCARGNKGVCEGEGMRVFAEARLGHMCVCGLHS